MSVREEIVATALAEVGYTESPVNRTKYGQWFGLDGEKWCAIFVCWVYFHSNMALPAIGFNKGFASCQKAVQFFRKLKRTIGIPKKGCLVFYDFDANGVFDHVGIFIESVLEDGVVKHTVVEGNTSIKNQRNGGAVMLRKRDPKKVKMLFVDTLYPF